MIKTIIVADDMTGANVSNSLLAKNGLKVGTLMEIGELDRLEDFDALGVHTDSRGISSKEAYDAVYENMKQFKEADVGFYNKRIDSTLRGNLGSETDAILDSLTSDEVAIFVPAFPNSGKIVIGGYMLVNGVPLEQTDVRNDPTSPVTQSKVIDILRPQTDRKIAEIQIDTVFKGEDVVRDRILQLKEEGVQCILIDAVTNEDIEVIAKATLQAKIPFVSVDPGPFTEALVKVGIPKEKEKGRQKTLFVIGSVSGIAVSQIANLRNVYHPFTIRINTKELLYKDRKEAELQRIVDLVGANITDESMFLVASMIEKEDKMDLAEVAKEAGLSVQETSETISKSIAEIAKNIIRYTGNQFGGFYTSGGDITKAFLEATESNGIEIKDEVIPLAVYGRVIGGKLDSKAIITKGGLVGDEHTLVECAEYLETKISTEYSFTQEMVKK